MSASIYYSATRPYPLSDKETAAIEKILKDFAVEDQIVNYIEMGKGYNWESFCVYEKPMQLGAIFEGATKLPDNCDEALDVGVKWWCLALTRIRHAVKGAEWDVRVEDYPVDWDEAKQAYVLAK